MVSLAAENSRPPARQRLKFGGTKATSESFNDNNRHHDNDAAATSKNGQRKGKGERVTRSIFYVALRCVMLSPIVGSVDVGWLWWQ